MITDFAMNFIKLAYTMEDATRDWNAKHSLDSYIANDANVIAAKKKAAELAEMLNKKRIQVSGDYYQLLNPFDERMGHMVGTEPAHIYQQIYDNPELFKKRYLDMRRNNKLQELLGKDALFCQHLAGGKISRPIPGTPSGDRLTQKYQILSDKVNAMPDSDFLSNIDADREAFRKNLEQRAPIQKLRDEAIHNIYTERDNLRYLESDARDKAALEFNKMREAGIQELLKQRTAEEAAKATEQAAREKAFKESTDKALAQAGKGVREAASNMAESATQAASKAAPVSHFGRNLGIAGATAALATPVLYYLYNRNRNQ